MRNKTKFLSVILSVFLLAGTLVPNAVVLAVEQTNYVVNGDFETDSDSNWKPDNWMVSSGIEPHTWLSGSENKVLSIKSTGVENRGTVTQAVYGTDGDRLPDGIYTLEAKIQGDISGIESLKLFVTDTDESDETSEECKDQINSSEFTTLKLENVKVTAGRCTIGIAVELNNSLAEWAWILDIDDISFYKTRNIGEQLPVVQSVENPEPISTVVNEVPKLPKTVKAYLSNGTTIDADVNWILPNPNLYTGEGTIGTSFTVNGTIRDKVAETDIPVEINVTVTYKTFDLNGDGRVDVGDLAIAAYYYGTDSNNDNWHNIETYDINGDGKIDLTELQLIAIKIANN
ncbi:dockerin type I domain-containing protein [Petroclostridium xylanilyticum]|jgi:hypothetical protein|uniref:dockerin type I domain-containing protein n=1 Tax=Petroclostridium xylanilyticum TaxID=1792311 RepID=UPI000B9873B7|nr:dockerin type I domain-containing protein [Petroclostridium xylanilyticum]